VYISPGKPLFASGAYEAPFVSNYYAVLTQIITNAHPNNAAKRNAETLARQMIQFEGRLSNLDPSAAAVDSPEVRCSIPFHPPKRYPLAAIHSELLTCD
jgi:hypothetical protein